MPVNDKLPILEPTQDNRKNGVATVCMIAAILVWSLGGVLTVFAALAYAEIGSFTEIFIELFPEGIMLTEIVLLGIGVFIGGMLLLAVSEALRLLQRNATTTYTIRYLDLVIPQTLSVSAFEENPDRGGSYDRNDSWNTDRETDSTKSFRTSTGDQGPISITVNVNAASGETDAASRMDGRRQPRVVVAPAPAADSSSGQKKTAGKKQAAYSSIGNLLSESSNPEK